MLPWNARSTLSEAVIFRRLAAYHGIQPQLASQRLHAIKRSLGLRPADNVLFDLTGNVYDPSTRQWLGSLTQGGKQPHLREGFRTSPWGAARDLAAGERS